MKKVVQKLVSQVPQIASLVEKFDENKTQRNLLLNGKTESHQINVNVSKEESERHNYIISLYQYLLKRKPEDSEVDAWYQSDYNYLELLKIFIESQEYQSYQFSLETEKVEYFTLLYKNLLGREPNSEEIKACRTSLFNPLELCQSLFDSEEYKYRQSLLTVDLCSTSFSQSHIVGENKPLGANQVFYWYKAVSEELMKQAIDQEKQGLIVKNQAEKIYALDQYTLAIITSVYKGEKYLDTFMENITNQTIFSECQLVIIDANSPEKEYEIVQPYLEKYPNIKYLKLDKTIGIYEAWNLAIKESKSEFITNANVDDLHRRDGLELKVQALRENPDIDVAYSDVYYSFIANLPFEIAEKGKIKTNLPTANKFNLLSFNSPHNSPIWRRSLHEKIGYFDPTYKSAGDHEFWLRAAFSGASFLKISEPVVAYYHNPDGLSTRKDSPGDIEGPATVNRYRALLET